MKILLTTIALLLLVVAPAAAQQTDSYGWEDGSATILGSYGNLVNPLNVGAPNPVNTGLRSLQVTEDPHSGTPEAYIACIDGLTDGDVVDADFWGYDVTPSASPSLRIWGGYDIDCHCVNYKGSASGNYTYTDGLGWGNVAFSWTFDSDAGDRSALVIKARLYSTPSTCDTCSTDFWIDDVRVTAPTTAVIYFPDEQPTATETSTWGQIKALFR